MQKGETAEALEAFGNVVISMFTLVFGKENTAKILEFYQDNYTEMATEITPFIANVIAPAVEQAVEKKKQQLANNFNFNKKQKHILGLK